MAADGEQQPPIDEGARAATRLIEKIGHGKCNSDLSEQLQRLGKELHDRWLELGGTHKGEVSLKLTFKIDDDGVVKAGYDVKTKMPPERRPGSIFFTTSGGNFCTENPRQPDLPGIREVPAPKQAPREIANPQQETRGV